MVILNGIQAEKLWNLLQIQNVDVETEAVTLETIGIEVRVQIVQLDTTKTWLIDREGKVTREDARL